MTLKQDRILVIKLGALGDFVQALGPMAAIRRHHAGAHVVLLTAKPYVEFAKASNLFDEVWVDEERPKAWQIGQVMRLRHKFKSGAFTRVYDLQTSDRSSFYFHILGPGKRPEWSGIALGCSHPHANRDRGKMHTIERQREQLQMAGISEVPAPDLSWAKADIGRFAIAKPYALLVPGGAPHRPAKRWPASHYAQLANHMLAEGLTPVLLGTRAEQGELHLIAHDAPGCVNLCAKTDFLDLAVLAQNAQVAVGNDTGPMHLIAAAGCASVVLYSHDSDPALCAQRGPRVKIVRQESLENLPESEVWAALRALISQD
ncbi:MAG: glycosyltransferase family 9 protein [Rhodospirillales bacterium]|nr:glycosyltransferase family 9 protein [Rhodospirillales bacterium]